MRTRKRNMDRNQINARRAYRRQDKPWIYLLNGKWYCVSNVFSPLSKKLIVGTGSTPRDAWLKWDEKDAPLS